MTSQFESFSAARTSILVAGLLLAAGCGGTWENAVLDAGDVSEESYNLNLHNGALLRNGLRLGSGFRLASGLALRHVLRLGNGLQLSNGVNIAEGKIAPPHDSDLDRWLDADFNNRKLLTYLIQCAVTRGKQIEITHNGRSRYVSGLIGLGPSWEDGPMTARDKQSVSACILARVNSQGRHIAIELKGPGIYEDFDDTMCTNSEPEAAFWGNLFGEEPYGYLCRAEDAIRRGKTRACGFDNCENDWITYVGECRDIVAGTPRCEWTSSNDSHFNKCRTNRWADGFRTVITAFRDYCN